MKWTSSGLLGVLAANNLGFGLNGTAVFLGILPLFSTIPLFKHLMPGSFKPNIPYFTLASNLDGLVLDFFVPHIRFSLQRRRRTQIQMNTSFLLECPYFSFIMILGTNTTPLPKPSTQASLHGSWVYTGAPTRAKKMLG
jgi:hypothetical protein